MKRLIAILFIAVGLSGCASVVQDAVKAVYGDSAYTQDAVKAAAIGMTAYDSTIQPQVERYKAWPKPGTPACAALKTTLLCRNEAVWQGMLKADDVASDAIHKARLIVDGVAADDTGTALSDAATAIRASEVQVLTSIPQVKP